MTTVDGHCHASPIWYEPVELLLYEMDRNAVDSAVLVQMQGQSSNEYLLDCARRFPGRVWPVVQVDVTTANASAQLQHLVELGAAGVRLNATDRSPGSDPLAIWRTAEHLRLPVSCAGRATDFASARFLQLVDQLPELVVVVEHFGGARDLAAEEDDGLRDRVFRLSDHPNVYMKIGGLGEFCERAWPPDERFPFKRPIPPLFDKAIQAFSPQRLMWGSDYPPVSQREGYGNALRHARAEVPPGSRALIFGDVAAGVFGRPR